MIRPLIAAALLLPLAGCQVFQALGRGPAASYLAADKATYDAISGEYVNYVNGDATLPQDQRDRRHRTIDTWRLRIERASPSTQPVTP